jgi:outer membrane protein
MQVDVFMKTYYRGFPSGSRVKPAGPAFRRVAWPAGAFIEASTAAIGNEAVVARLLRYLEPTSTSAGRPDRRARPGNYISVGVSHRSGIFSSSRLLGNVVKMAARTTSAVMSDCFSFLGASR